jgi:hypothetical protein
MKTVGILSLSLVSLIACGGLDSDRSQKAPLATVVGQLSASTSAAATGPNVRVALLWGSEEREDFSAASDLPVQPVFPSKFRIELRDAPPEVMFFTPFAKRQASGGTADPTPVTNPPSPGGSPGTPEPIPGSGSTPSPGAISTLRIVPTEVQSLRVALGSVVAYEDRNGNGKLDFVDNTAASFTDTIVGANPELLVAYFDGLVPVYDDLRDDAGRLPSSGYNLYRRGGNCPEPLGAQDTLGRDGEPTPPVAPACTPTASAWLSMDTLYDLTLGSSPRVNEWMCKDKRPGDSVVSAFAMVQRDGRPAQYPLADDTKLECAGDKKTYIYGTRPTCTTLYKGACIGDVTTCVGGSVLEQWTRPSPVPSDWPCN